MCIYTYIKYIVCVLYHPYYNCGIFWARLPIPNSPVAPTAHSAPGLASAMTEGWWFQHQIMSG